MSRLASRLFHDFFNAGSNRCVRADHGKTALDYAEQNNAPQGTEALERLRKVTSAK